jgi:hypothetical protein
MRSCYRVLICTVGLFALAAGATSAQANSRFTVVNGASNEALVNIFDGGDDLCSAEAKHHTVGPGNKRSMGCTGDDKHHCKARVSLKQSGKWTQICPDETKGCGNTAIVMPNKSTLKIIESSSGGISCKIETD